MQDPTISTIRINGGRLCLDFVNTAAYRDGRMAHDFLTSFDDLVTWGERQGLVDRDGADELWIEAGELAKPAARMLALARNLRAALRDIFMPGVPAAHVEIALEALNAVAPRVLPALRLQKIGESIRFAPGATLESWLIGPLAISALDLASSPARAAVQMCPGEGCHWLFLDLSRNATRRWCSMASCGNKAKARAHYATHRAGTRP